MPSFDIVSKTEMTSVDNALQGVVKEMQVRYDFKGSKSEVSKNDDVITILADDELKRRQVEELLITHLTRKGVDTKALEFGKLEQAGGNMVRQLFRSDKAFNVTWHKKLSKPSNHQNSKRKRPFKVTKFAYRVKNAMICKPPWR